MFLGWQPCLKKRRGTNRKSRETNQKRCETNPPEEPRNQPEEPQNQPKEPRVSRRAAKVTRIAADQPKVHFVLLLEISRKLLTSDDPSECVPLIRMLFTKQGQYRSEIPFKRNWVSMDAPYAVSTYIFSSAGTLNGVAKLVRHVLQQNYFGFIVGPTHSYC